MISLHAGGREPHFYLVLAVQPFPHIGHCVHWEDLFVVLSDYEAGTLGLNPFPSRVFLRWRCHAFQQRNLGIAEVVDHR